MWWLFQVLIAWISISIILILSTERFFFRIINWWRRSKFNNQVTIGVLNGEVFELQKGKVDPPSPFSDYSYKDWFDSFSSDRNFKVDLISANEISSKFDMILNPFGELYLRLIRRI